MQLASDVITQLEVHSYYDLAEIIRGNFQLASSLVELLNKPSELQYIKENIDPHKVKFLLKALDEAVRVYAKTLDETMTIADLHFKFINFAESCLQLLEYDIKSFRHTLIHISYYTTKLAIHHLHRNDEVQLDIWYKKTNAILYKALELSAINADAPNINFADRLLTLNLRARSNYRIYKALEKVNRETEGVNLLDLIIEDILIAVKLINDNPKKFESFHKDSFKTPEESKFFIWGELVNPVANEMAKSIEEILKFLEINIDERSADADLILAKSEMLLKYLILFSKLIKLIETVYLQTNYDQFYATFGTLSARVNNLFSSIMNRYPIQIKDVMYTEDFRILIIKLKNDFQTFFDADLCDELCTTNVASHLLASSVLKILEPSVL